MMKKIISLITILCLILPFMYATQSYAETNDVSFSVKKMNIQRGETITEVVDMNCTTNFSAANFVLTYDSNVLEYVPYYDEDNEVDYNQNCGQTILNSSGIPNATVLINSDTVGTIKVGYMSTKSVAGKSGEFLKFKFKVKDNAEYGNSNITINATTLKDENGTNLNAQYSNGIVSILSAITMSTSNLEMLVGEQNHISVEATNGSIFDSITWTSSDSNIVNITSNTGTKEIYFTAVSAGSATITASVGGVSATCTVIVTEPEEEYTISITNPSWTFLPATQKRTLSASFNPVSFGTGKTITWSSSNTNVATVNSSTGEITAVANGTTTITATDGNKNNTYTLTVNKTLGDIDEDSKITSYDAYKALVLYANQTLEETVNENEVVILDVERDGNMSSNDAYLILKYSVGLISNF